TDDSYAMEDVGTMTHRQFLQSFLGSARGGKIEEQLSKAFNFAPDAPELERFRWSGLFSDELVGLEKGTPAQVLEHILNKRWKLGPDDRDLIVMWHRFCFLKGGKEKEIQASLVATGEDAIHTAMAKTVGLPLAIAARLLLEGKISSRGVMVPVQSEIYSPVLEELKKLGIALDEREVA
ncbi:MAG: saccharopine dehydrogenase, partial [Cyclobacteriaceae bacterium]|nr:saccharopine dehydrogenase [Cyclobacteriaceae bacterium]